MIEKEEFRSSSSDVIHPAKMIWDRAWIGLRESKKADMAQVQWKGEAFKPKQEVLSKGSYMHA